MSRLPALALGAIVFLAIALGGCGSETPDRVTRADLRRGGELWQSLTRGHELRLVGWCKGDLAGLRTTRPGVAERSELGLSAGAVRLAMDGILARDPGQSIDAACRDAIGELDDLVGELPKVSPGVLDNGTFVAATARRDTDEAGITGRRVSLIGEVARNEGDGLYVRVPNPGLPEGAASQLVMVPGTYPVQGAKAGRPERAVRVTGRMGGADGCGPAGDGPEEGSSECTLVVDADRVALLSAGAARRELARPTRVLSLDAEDTVLGWHVRVHRIELFPASARLGVVATNEADGLRDLSLISATPFGASRDLIVENTRVGQADPGKGFRQSVALSGPLPVRSGRIGFVLKARTGYLGPRTGRQQRFELRIEGPVRPLAPGG